jgi:ApbE superfamily uncharacterized protein (UPF0280 family)
LERVYRQRLHQEDLTHFQVVVRETDLFIGVRRDRFAPVLAREVERYVQELRRGLESYIAGDPAFLHAMEPHPVRSGAPRLAADMAAAAAAAGVGPMAAVAGAIADHVGRFLARYSRDVFVENGGDLFIKSARRRLVGIYAGNSPLSNRIGVEVTPGMTPLGLCTSSGTIGHSVSFGAADAATILASSAALADAVATAAANRVKTPADLAGAVEFALSVAGVTGALAIMGDKLAVKGQLKLAPL